MRRFLLCCLLLVGLFTTCLRAETVQSVPNPLRTKRSWVGDNANVIDASNERQINQAIEAFKNQTGGEITVITVNDVNGEVPKSFATELFNLWGVGEKGKDNGVLILVVMDGRRIAIETGYGAEGDLPDSKAMSLVRELAVPRFKEGDFGGGLLALTNEYIRVLSGSAASTAAPSTKASKPPRPQNRNAPTTQRRTSAVPSSSTYTSPSNAPSNNATPSNSASGPFEVIVGLLILAMFPIGFGVVIWGIVSVFKGLATRKCQTCGRVMRRLDENEEDAFLSSDQQFEERLGGLDYKVWKCDTCGVCHIERSARWMSNYKECPRCHHYTLKVSSETIEQPTYYSTGRRQTDRICEYPNCGHHEQSTETLPMLQRHVVVASSPSWGSSSSSDSSWGSSSSSSGSDFSSSSSDFGGGSSGGGGGETGW